MLRSKTSHRTFLQKSTAAATLGAVHTAAEEKPKKVSLGIIGCGGIMKHHVHGLAATT